MSGSRLGWSLGATVFVLTALAVVASHRLHAYNSDDVAIQVALFNLRLGHANQIILAYDSFIIKAPAYWLLHWLLREGRAALLVTALSFNLVGIGAYTWSFWRLTTASKVSRWPRAAALVWLISLGTSLFGLMVNPNTRNLEIGLSFGLVALIASLYERNWRPSGRIAWAGLVAGAILVGLFLFSDPYFIYVLIGPLLLFCLVDWVGRGGVRSFWLAGWLVGSLICQRLWLAIFHWLGVGLYTQPPRLPDLSQLGHNAYLLVQGLTSLLGADWFGRNAASFGAVRTGLNFIWLSLGLIAAAYWLIVWLRQSKSHDRWLGFLAGQALLTMVVFMLNTNISGLDDRRYLIIVPFSLAPLLSASFSRLRPARLKRLAGWLLGLSIGLNLLYLFAQLRLPAASDQPSRAIIATAAAHGATKGYAQYWDSNINTYLSSNSVKFIQANCVDGRTEPYYWVLNTNVLNVPAHRSFYLLRRPAASPLQCAPEAVVTQFGRPTQKLDVGRDYELWLYDYDITHRR